MKALILILLLAACGGGDPLPEREKDNMERIK